MAQYHHQHVRRGLAPGHPDRVHEKGNSPEARESEKRAANAEAHPETGPSTAIRRHSLQLGHPRLTLWRGWRCRATAIGSVQTEFGGRIAHEEEYQAPGHKRQYADSRDD